MKYDCLFCKSKMTYHAETQYFDWQNNNSIHTYLIHKCTKARCKIGLLPKCKIWEYRGHVQGLSLILDFGLKTYKIVSRYDLNKTSLAKVEILPNSDGSFQLDNIMETDESIKIDLADPINSGLQVINRLLKLRAFS